MSAYVRLGSPSLNWGLVADLHREHQASQFCYLERSPSFAVALSDWVLLTTQQDAAEFVFSLSSHVPILAEICWEARIQVDTSSVTEWKSPLGMAPSLTIQDGVGSLEMMIAKWSDAGHCCQAFLFPSEVLWVQVTRFVDCEAGGVRKVHHPLDLRHRRVNIPIFSGPSGVDREWHVYRILSVVAHHGLSIRNGHYTTMLWTESVDQSSGMRYVDDYVISSPFSTESSAYARYSEDAYLVVMAREDALVPMGT